MNGTLPTLGVGPSSTELQRNSRRILESDGPCEDDQVCPTESMGIVAFKDGLEQTKNLWHRAVVDGPILLRAETNPGAVCATTVVGHAVRPGAGERQTDKLFRVGDSAASRQKVRLNARNYLLVVGQGQLWVWQRILERLGRRSSRPPAPGIWSHIAGQQLVPRVAKVMLQRGKVLRISVNKLEVLFIPEKGYICGQHHGLRHWV
mmetsp:Transcript_10976/g.29010  ORF Transcript_10976/g.29010 Transcript_10976/m.29010 type:complete len:205 (-) Transcript_10976:1194-1808(-)